MPVTFIVVGIAAGVLAGLFGIGGGIIIVPALIYLARMPFLNATGTSLAALLLPVGVLGAWSYYQEGHVNVRAALLIAAGLTIGAWFGAELAQHLPITWLRRSFAVFLVIMAIRMWVKG